MKKANPYRHKLSHLYVDALGNIRDPRKQYPYPDEELPPVMEAIWSVMAGLVFGVIALVIIFSN